MISFFVRREYSGSRERHNSQTCMDSHTVMICVKTEHFDINRLLLLSIGLWPYQRSKLVQLQMILFSSILVSIVVLQFTVFIIAECTSTLIIRVLSNASFCAMYAITYISFLINAGTVRNFLEELQDICNQLKDKNEIAIIKKYGNEARLYTGIITLFSLCSVAITTSLVILPRFRGSVLLSNESHSSRLLQRVIPIMGYKYFVKEESHFYLIFLYVSAVFSIGGTAMAATGMMLIGYLKHACGMFKIASYRIEKAMKGTLNVSKDINPEREIVMYKEIIYAVDIHRKAIRFSVGIFSSFKIPYFTLVMIAVVCLSLNLYGISECISLENDVENLLVHLLIATEIFLYLLIGNYAGQEIIDHSNDVFFTAYNVRWYFAPLHVQKLILFFLQRDSKPIGLSLGGVFMASLELYATVDFIFYFIIFNQLCIMYAGIFNKISIKPNGPDELNKTEP